jgi:hypothetical protein
MSVPGDGDQPSISFVQYLQPALKSGKFTLTATQVIAVLGGQVESLQATQSFSVQGLRYQLDDDGVDSVFPPSGGRGQFGTVLPHVVLTDPTLPWQRSPTAQSAQQVDTAARREGAPAGVPVPSWLALLLFDEQDPPPKPQGKTVADLASGNGIFVPPRAAEPGDKLTDPVMVIDVPVNLYAQITPSLDDLTWLAHTRLAEASAKATVRDIPPKSEFAVVFGNRLPTPGRTSTAVLVSLEGFGRYLPSDDGVAPTTIPDQTTAVRLVVLRTWTFSTVQVQQDFQGILDALHMAPPTLQLPVDSVPPGAAGQAVSQAFNLGYTAMNHRLRDGSSTVSWYRGPLLPLGATVPAVTQAQASDQLLRYDPGSGMFDVSYAAAWQLGRLLALHDRAYATALFRWRLTVDQEAAAQLEEEIVDQLLPPLPPAPSSGEDDPLASLPPMHRRLVRAIRDVVSPAADRIAERGGQ